MASILKKAQQKKEQTKTKAVTNLNVLNQQEVIEDKIPSSNTIAKKVEEDHEQIDLSNIKPVEKVVEETENVQTTTQKQNIENTTWVDTKDLDEQEALRIAASQVQTEKEDPNKGKKVMRSWVPQLREDGQGAVATFNEEASYFPEMDAEILTKKVEKKVASTTTISRADESNSSSNPPRFQNSNKGGFKQLELTEQQKKLLELDEQNKKEYRNPNNGPGFSNQTETTESFMPSNSSQPPRFMNKKTEGGNFVALQKSELDLKQEEAQKRAEERLKELKAAALLAAETKAEQANTGDDMRRAPRFTGSKTNNPEETEKKAETTAEEAAKPAPKFMNTNKSSNGPNFKPLETKEVKLPEVLENKKYLPKKGENDNTNNNNNKKDSERKERKERQQKEESDGEESEPEFDENGFKIVREEKRTIKTRNYKNGGNKNNKQTSEKKKDTQAEEQTQEIQA